MRRFLAAMLMVGLLLIPASIAIPADKRVAHADIHKDLESLIQAKPVLWTMGFSIAIAHDGIVVITIRGAEAREFSEQIDGNNVLIFDDARLVIYFDTDIQT